jgi:16S rRNA G966 N2-methylase RsmD
MIKRGPMDWPTPHMCLAGSGVLALAALKLGASKAVGTDVDPLAVSKHNRLLFAID